MLKVGLTGGIAAGKSVVGEMFVALGAHLVQADRIAHSLMEPGEAVYHEVVRQFGQEILNADGTVNRGKLGEIAFGGGPASRVAELNRIVHPAVIRRQEEWMESVGEKDPGGVAIVEAALLIEAGAAKHFHRIVVVTCTMEQRVERFATRQKIDLEAARKEVWRRMAAQLPDEEKIKVADFVIDNAGPLPTTREQVQRVWEILHTAAP
jgi:dephospho-CoA kinase